MKNDKRYIMFDHVPDQRERWLRVIVLLLHAPFDLYLRAFARITCHNWMLQSYPCTSDKVFRQSDVFYLCPNYMPYFGLYAQSIARDSLSKGSNSLRMATPWLSCPWQSRTRNVKETKGKQPAGSCGVSSYQSGNSRVTLSRLPDAKPYLSA